MYTHKSSQITKTSSSKDALTSVGSPEFGHWPHGLWETRCPDWALRARWPRGHRWWSVHVEGIRLVWRVRTSNRPYQPGWVCMVCWAWLGMVGTISNQTRVSLFCSVLPPICVSWKLVVLLWGLNALGNSFEIPMTPSNSGDRKCDRAFQKIDQRNFYLKSAK